MRRLLKRDQAAGLALTLAGLISLVGFVAPTGRALADGPVSISDPAGDTINRDTNQKLAAPAADILSATVDSGVQGIVLTFKTQQMADPATDPNWASPNTFVSWQVDDNGDGKVDDLIRFSADRTTPGGITGDLTHWSGPGIPAKHCDAQPGFDPAVGYSLTIAASCVANPAAISYRVQITYDTQPSAAKPPLAFDVAPDQGLAGPVPIFVPTAPAQAPPAAGAPANGGTPAAGTPTAPAGGGTPTSAKPAAPAKPAAKPPTTAPARRPSSSALATRAPAATTPTTTPTAPRPDLAATGPGAARALGALAGALLLLGGFTLMVPPERRRRPA